MKNDPVTVKELMEILKTFPEDLPVLVSGYESGYEYFYQPEIRELVKKRENMHWDGEYQVPEQGEAAELSALVLERVNRDD
jgi:hypothetical protein